MASKDASPVIVWFRQDLRLADNPALAEAVALGKPIVALYILDDDTPGPWAMGGASRWWLHHSLTALAASLKEIGGALVLKRGAAAKVLDAVIKESGADTVHWNRCYEPYAVKRDTALKEALTKRDITVRSFNGSLLFEPWTVKTQGGEPYKVFTPFWRACRAIGPDTAMAQTPEAITAATGVKSDALASWGLLPTKPNWAKGFEDWTPGEDGAKAQMTRFLRNAVSDYGEGRNRPDQEGTSRLSPHLHFGEIGPRQAWRAIQHNAARHPEREGQADIWLAEIGWREFAHHMLYATPHLPERCFRPEFDAMPWRRDAKGLKAWQHGMTGYPIVDAGMRQLWQTGWMHNRVRMIVGSFLVKHLLLPWQDGEAWFWDTLVDADLAANAFNWQWVAGCGADAAPYFRVFNPVLQGQKFDPDGDYVRGFVPELGDMPAKHIHEPWAAPKAVLEKAKVSIGKTYPEPIVDLKAGRDRALAAFAKVRGGG